MDFQKKPSVQKLWREKTNMLMSILLTTTSSGADAATFCLSFRRQGLLWFFQSLAVGCTLPGILVRQRATIGVLYSCTGLRLCSAAFCILSITLSLTLALSERLAHAQQHFSTSTPAKGLHFSAFHTISERIDIHLIIMSSSHILESIARMIILPAHK